MFSIGYFMIQDAINTESLRIYIEYNNDFDWIFHDTGRHKY